MHIVRNNIVYYRLENGTLYCGPLDQSNKVGGTGEEKRNAAHNPTRLERIKEINPKAKVLDYGCGNGLLVKYLLSNDIDAVGFDPFNETYASPIAQNAFDVITAIEVFEHLSEPYYEVDQIFNALKEGGIVMIETSFTDWMKDDDSYINPAIGHSTIFSHKGLDELMTSRGFKIGNHINRNVRLYRKPKTNEEVKKLTLITMGQGNPVALKRTLDSFKGICNEVVFGDVLIFDSDREIIRSYQEEYNMGIVEAPFNYIFEFGFAHMLNTLAYYATNDWVLYMNVGEMIDSGENILEKINDDHNMYLLNHRTETHLWGRLYNRKQLQWSGLIHEELIGQKRACFEPIFMFKDTEKDMGDLFKAKVWNDVKELTYFNQLIRLVDNPEVRGATNPGWVDYAKDSYDSLVERLQKKGKRYEAFKEGNLAKFMEDIFSNPEFEEERHESSTLINFQGARKDIL